MRIRLAHTQALVLLSAVLLTVICMGALNAWNLRNGFTDFLASRDVERLENFASLVSARAEAAGGLEAMAAQGVDMRLLLREFGQAQGGVPREVMTSRMPHLGPGEFFPPPHGPRPPHTGPPPHLREPPPRSDSLDAFKDRVALYTLTGQAILGKPLPADAGPHVERPVSVQGKTVGVLHMLKLKPVPDDVETRFLTSQYQSILLVAGLLLLAALLGARWVANHWVRPLIEMQTATQRIAQGAFDTRLNPRRADEIGDAMRNINRMAEGLQKLETSRRRWIADMSHELRTPLTVLRGEIEALMDGIMPMTPQALVSLHEEVLQLNALVDDLHLLAMADLRALPCEFEDLDAVALVQGIVQRFSLRASQQGVTLSLVTAPEGPWGVRWDSKRMEQLLGNVLDNSLRYTDAPGQVRVEIKRSGKGIHIGIEDSAPGLTVADLTRIFEPLYRADPARGRDTGGSGLGLAICLQIAKAHQGQIWAEPSPMGGVKFNIELPLMGEITA